MNTRKYKIGDLVRVSDDFTCADVAEIVDIENLYTYVVKALKGKSGTGWHDCNKYITNDYRYVIEDNIHLIQPVDVSVEQEIW